MRILMVAILFIIPTMLHAADLCDAGYYLTDANECEKCPAGTYSDTPGATACTPCPDVATHLRTTFPDNYYENPVIMSFEAINNQYRDKISGCCALTRIRTDRGEINDSASYNPETEQYDRTYASNWRSVKPGYYLTTPSTCGSLAFYKDLLECPAGFYCPGKDFVHCNAENKAEVHTPTFGLEICPTGTYSAPGADACTAECPAGTYNVAGTGECEKCPAGTYSNTPGATACTTVTAKYYATGCDDNGTKCTGEAKCKRTNYCTGGVMFPCPDPDTHRRTTFPDYYYGNPVVTNTTSQTEAGTAGSISECRVITGIDTDRGHVSDYAAYNPETEEYDITGYYLWDAVKPGYYLKNNVACGTYTYYTTLLECPAGSYCPGKDRVVCGPSNKDEVYTPTFGLETCPAGTYSDAGAATCTECTAGMYSTAGAAQCTRCPAGKYSAAGADACTRCPDTTWSDAGAATCNPCPDPATHLRTTFPDNYYENPRIDNIVAAGNELGNISKCTLHTRINTDRGELFDYTYYNPETEEYDNTYLHLWYLVKPGYYLTTPTTCGALAYYDDARECPAGAYCPGQARVSCNATNKDEVHTPTFGLEICPDNSYSDAGASVCVPCNDGTGNNGDQESDHANASSCLGLCTAGYTKLNVAGRKFNLWPRSLRTSPALCTEVNDNVCCVHMAPGNGPGINVELHNKIYHTTN